MENLPSNFYSFTLSDWIQIVLGILGFGIAFWQLGKTKNAIKASTDATEKTLLELSKNITREDLDSIISGFMEIHIYLLNKQYAFADNSLLVTNKKIKKLCHRKSYEDPERNSEIDKIHISLEKLHINLVKAISEGKVLNDVPKVSANIARYSDYFSALSEEFRFNIGSEK